MEDWIANWDIATKAIIGTIATSITGIMIATITKIIKSGRKNKAEIDETLDALCESNRNLLRKDIIYIYEEALEKGYITNLKLAAAEESYTSYRRLKGNKFIEDVMVKLRAMNIKALNIEGL